MKTFVLTVSTKFPKTHKRAGEETNFHWKIIQSIKRLGTGIASDHLTHVVPNKFHTIRSNYDLWAKRIEQIQKGEAILSLRYWSGKPYSSKQIEFCQLDKNSGIGIQKLCFYGGFSVPCISEKNPKYAIEAIGEQFGIDVLAANDGLSFEDFKEWFKNYDLSKPMAIIHFTKKRY
jgi:hypothetical protein